MLLNIIFSKSRLCISSIENHIFGILVVCHFTRNLVHVVLVLYIRVFYQRSTDWVFAYRAGADHPRTPRSGGLMRVKGLHHGVKGKGAHGNEIVTLLLESDD